MSNKPSWQEELSKYEEVEPTGAVETLGQSFFRTTPELIGNLLLKTGLTNPKVLEEALPRNKSYEKGALKHPISDFTGAAIASIPLMGSTSAAIRAVPGVSNLMKAASPSLIKRTAVHAGEGGILGALYSQPGHEKSGAGYGALIGGLLGGPGIASARKSAEWQKSGKDVVNIEELGHLRNQAEQSHSEQQNLIKNLLSKYRETGSWSAPEDFTRDINKTKSKIEEFRPMAEMPIEEAPDIEQHKLELENAEHAHNEQQRLIQEIKDLHKTQGTGLQDPLDIERKINEKTARLEELQEHANIPFREPTNLEAIPSGKPELDYANKAVANKEAQIGSFLSSNMPKGVEFAEEHYGSIQKAKKHIQKEYYAPVDEYAKDSHLKLPRTDDVKALEHKLQSFFGNKLTKDEPGFNKMREAFLKQNPAGHDLVPTYDFIQNWKDTKQAAAKARRLGFKEGGENQGHWQKEAENLQQLANEQLALLKSHLPKEMFQKLEKAGEVWKNEITPFYGNKIYEQSRPLPNRGKIDVKDILHEIRANEAGQVKSRELILANPNLTRLALGHKYAEKPGDIRYADTYEQQFIDNLPVLKQLQEELHGHHRNKAIAEAYHAQQKGHIEEISRQNKTLIDEQNKRLAAINEAEKTQASIADLKQKNRALSQELQIGKIKQSEYDSAKKVHDDAIKIYNDIMKKRISKEQAQSKIMQLEKDIKEYEKEREALSMHFKQGEIKESEFKKLDEEYKNAIKIKKSLKGKLKTIALTAMQLGGIATSISSLMK